MDLTRFVVEHFSSAQKICGTSSSWHRGTRLNASSQTVVLCCLMPLLSDSWLARSDLLGQYAMTTERYGAALQCITFYLLQLPTDILEQILNSHPVESDIFDIPIVYLIDRVLPSLISRSPPTPDLYFLLPLITPVMRSFHLYDELLTYTKQVSRFFAPTQFVLTIIPFPCQMPTDTREVSFPQ